MKIYDLEGKEITVTDLDEAIKVAAVFRGYRHTDRSFAAFDRERKVYWTDILLKLKQLKKTKDSGHDNEFF